MRRFQAQLALPVPWPFRIDDGISAEKRADPDVLVTELLPRPPETRRHVSRAFKRVALRFGGHFHACRWRGVEIHVALKAPCRLASLAELAQNVAASPRAPQGGPRAGRSSYSAMMSSRMPMKAAQHKRNRSGDCPAHFHRVRRWCSARHIATRLNREGIGRQGGALARITIAGNKARASGLLHNEMYRGVIVYNRQRFPRHPETGRRIRP